MLNFILTIVFGYFALKGLAIMFTGGTAFAKGNPEICKAGAKRFVKFLTK